jgi:aarF domain-containing kinase
MFLNILRRAFVVWWILLRYGFPWIFLKSQRPALMRRGFERLGPTYLKFGQIIASSPGLFPKPYVEEFQKCLDRVPPFSFAEVKETIERELGKPMAQVYSLVEETPIAAASIAQVHAAKLADGTDVVVKVQRPHIKERVQADLWFMRKLAWMAEKMFVTARLANATGVVDDFSKTIAEELDFRTEGRNMDEFNAIMKKHGTDHEIVAPKVFWDFTAPKLLTMERFYGFKADDVAKFKALGIDAEKWLRIGMRGWNMTMMLHGFFHGDVHAGNLMFLPERKQIGFIDFGIVGRFDKDQRMQVLRYVLSFNTQDFEELSRVMVEMGAVDKNIDVKALADDLKQVYSPLLSRALSEIEYGRVLPDIIANSRKHGIMMPREFILILKQLLYFDRYAKLAAPQLNVFNDLYLIDFLFSPAAAESGIDMGAVGRLIMSIQQAAMARTSAS